MTSSRVRYSPLTSPFAKTAVWSDGRDARISLRAGRVVLLQDRNPADQLVAGERLFARVRLELVLFCTLAGTVERAG